MKKKILSFLCTFCMLVTCMVALSACKKNKDTEPSTPPAPAPAPEKVVSSSFYLDETQLSNANLSYVFGDDVLTELNKVSFTASVDSVSQTFKLLDLPLSLTYNNFESDSVLSTLPEEWSAGTYTFSLSISVAEETFTASFVVSVGKIASDTVFDLNINEEDVELSMEYDNSSSLGNDPIFTLYQEAEVFLGENLKFYYISASQYEAYQALTSAAEKYNFLETNKTLYNGTYQMVPENYYIFAAIDNGINYKDSYTNLVKLTITKAQQDYSMLNIPMTYTFNTDTCTGNYVTLEQIVEEIGMPTIAEFDGTIEWADDYSDLEISYVKENPTIDLQVKLTPNNPYIEYSRTVIDVVLTLKQGLIPLPTLIDESLVFMYTGAEQGITVANGSQFFDNWFSETDAQFVDANFDTHTNVGNYTLVIGITSNPNFTFTEDGETASAIREFSIDWSIAKANHRCNVLGLSSSPIPIVNTETIETTETLSAENKIALPTFIQFYYELYIDQELQYTVIDEPGVTTGVAEIVGNDLVVTTKGTVVLKVVNPGNSNVEAIELTIIYNFV